MIDQEYIGTNILTKEFETFTEPSKFSSSSTKFFVQSVT